MITRNYHYFLECDNNVSAFFLFQKQMEKDELETIRNDLIRTSGLSEAEVSMGEGCTKCVNWPNCLILCGFFCVHVPCSLLFPWTKVFAN